MDDMSKTLVQVVVLWPHDAKVAGEEEVHSEDCHRCQIERWVCEQLHRCDEAEQLHRTGQVGSLGPLYDVGVGVGREAIRKMLGLLKD